MVSIYTMGSEEFDGSTQGDSGVLSAEAHQRMDINISTVAAYLKISCAGTANFREGTSVIQMEHGRARGVFEGEGLCLTSLAQRAKPLAAVDLGSHGCDAGEAHSQHQNVREGETKVSDPSDPLRKPRRGASVCGPFWPLVVGQ
jgi:hypothetical protein